MTADVVVDKVTSGDHETNAGPEFEWRFDGMTPEDQDDLHITTEEEDSIHAQLCRWLEERE